MSNKIIKSVNMGTREIHELCQPEVIYEERVEVFKCGHSSQV